MCATLGRLKASEPSLKAELTHAFTHGEHVASILYHARQVILRHSTNYTSDILDHVQPSTIFSVNLYESISKPNVFWNLLTLIDVLHVSHNLWHII